MLHTLPLCAAGARRLAAFVLAGLVAASVARADVIYRETFGRPSDVTTDMATYTFGWNDFLGNGTINATISNSGINGSTNGNPIDVANVNAGTNSDGTTGAYARGLHFFLTGAGASVLTYTPEFQFNPSSYVDGSITFSWEEGNAVATDTFRLALQIGGAWYVSAATFSTPATTLGNFASAATLESTAFNPTASNWMSLNFDGSYDGNTAGTGTASSGAISVGGTAGADLSGMITAFGLYLDTAGGTRRFDTFQIDATPIPVPEPGTYASMAGLAACVVSIWRRRVRRG